MATQPGDGTPEKSDSVKRIAQLRDVILVGGTLLYILGYIVWALNAWANNLGLLPALQAQYLISGIPPALIIVLAWIAIEGSKRFTCWLQSSYFIEKPRLLPLLIGCVAQVAFTLSFMFAVASSFDWFARLLPFPPETVRATAWSVVLILMSVGAHFVKPQRTFVMLFHSYYPVVLFSLIGFGVYIFVVYPVVPQSLGGMRPRSAYLDLRREEVSRETIAALVSPNEFASGDRIVRSKRLQVYFCGSDSMLVTETPTKQDTNWRIVYQFFFQQDGLRSPSDRNSTVYEIRKTVIQSVTWSD